MRDLEELGESALEGELEQEMELGSEEAEQCEGEEST